MKILSIETSCDETGISIIDADGDFNTFKCTVLADQLLSQASKHAEYGGVFPNLAKREHAKNLLPLLQKAISECSREPLEHSPITDEKLNTIKDILEREPELFVQLTLYLAQGSKPDIDAIAITHGPGLAPALWVGVNFARALSVAWDIPIVPVNHMEGHIFSALLKKDLEVGPLSKYSIHDVQFPAISLLVSGGHTQLILIKNWYEYELLGQTRDDAVGEAFDKVARLLGLQYPGGPEISRLAQEARTSKLEPLSSKLPRPMLHTNDYDFSFSGLKTAVLTLTKELGELTDIQKMQIAREFEDAAADVLATKLTSALHDTGAQTVLIGGGVSANSHINKSISDKLKGDCYNDVSLYVPDKGLTGDNALMIAFAGYFRAKNSEYIKQEDLEACANLKLAN